MLGQESLDLFISSRKDISWIVLATKEFISMSSSDQEVRIIASGQSSRVSS